MTIARESMREAGTTAPSREYGPPGKAAASVSDVRTVATRDGLAAINEPSTELVIWQRSLPPSLTDWIDCADADSLPHVRLFVRPGDLRPALGPVLDQCGLPAGDMRELLLVDIEGLLKAFADITGSDHVDVRLERIEHDACWKFHRDSVEVRLVTTYRGPATEWVRTAHAEQAIAEQKDFAGPLEKLGDHDVALFKGSRAGTNSGIVHRSPPIVGTGFTRLLLCLNKRTIVSPGPWARD